MRFVLPVLRIRKPFGFTLHFLFPAGLSVEMFFILLFVNSIVVAHNSWTSDDAAAVPRESWGHCPAPSLEATLRTTIPMVS